MAETTKAAEPLVQVEKRFNQVVKDTDPQGTEKDMRAAGMDVRKYGSCSPSRTHKAVPEDERVRGCQSWKQCTLVKIKGVAGPINLSYRLYKKNGIIREGWGPCYEVFRLADQYNTGNENFVMEILPPGSEVEIRGSKLIRNPDGSEIWEDTLEKQTPPPFPKIGERGHLLHEAQAQRVRKQLMKQRAERFVDQTMGISPEDVEAANQKTNAGPNRTGA